MAQTPSRSLRIANPHEDQTSATQIATPINSSTNKQGVINDTAMRSEEHTSELQSLMRISYAVLCLKKKNTMQRTAKDHKTQRRPNEYTIKQTQNQHKEKHNMRTHISKKNNNRDNR